MLRRAVVAAAALLLVPVLGSGAECEAGEADANQLVQLHKGVANTSQQLKIELEIMEVSVCDGDEDSICSQDSNDELPFNRPGPLHVDYCDPGNQAVNDRGWLCISGTQRVLVPKGTKASFDLGFPYAIPFYRKNRNCSEPVLLMNPKRPDPNVDTGFVKCQPCEDEENQQEGRWCSPDKEGKVSKEPCVGSSSENPWPTCDPCDPDSKSYFNLGWYCYRSTDRVCVDGKGWAVLNPLFGRAMKLGSLGPSIPDCDDTCKLAFKGLAFVACGMATGSPLAALGCADLVGETLETFDPSSYLEPQNVVEKIDDFAKKLLEDPPIGKAKKAFEGLLKGYKLLAKGTKAVGKGIKVGLKKAGKKTFAKIKKDVKEYAAEQILKLLEEDEEKDDQDMCGPPFRDLPEVVENPDDEPAFGPGDDAGDLDSDPFFGNDQ